MVMTESIHLLPRANHTNQARRGDVTLYVINRGSGTDFKYEWLLEY